MLLFLSGAVLLAAVAWYGHWREQGRLADEAALASSAAPVIKALALPVREAASAPSAALTAASAAAERAISSAVDAAPVWRWPLWEFQFKQPIQELAVPLTPRSWRIAGATLSSDGWRVLIIRQGAAAPEYRAVGDVLPGGYKVRNISDEDVSFEFNGREIVLSYTGTGSR